MTLTWKPVHPDRWNPSTVLRKRLVVVHTSESGDTSAQSLINFMALPGDRLGATRYGSSYHAVASNDPNDVPYMEVQGADHGPFAAPPRNYDAWHIVLPGRAAQSRDEWLDRESRFGIYGAACFIVDKCHVDNLPMLRCSVSDLLAGDAGYCGHVDVSNAWHSSDHTDPGPNFPWDVLAADIALLTADEEETMELVQVSDNGVDDTAIYLRFGNTITWCEAHVDEAAIAGGLIPAGSKPRKIPRLSLKAMVLYGAIPNNGTNDASMYRKVI